MTPARRQRCSFRLVRALVLVLGFGVAVASAQDAREWLERMSRAAEELSYRGTYVHMHGDTAETVQIVHSYRNGEVNERLLSLNGAGREIVRTPLGVQCIYPDKRMVLLEPVSDLRSLASELPSYSEDLVSHYEFELHGASNVARRAAQIVGIMPRDEFRYGYLLWLDEATGMPLKIRLSDENTEVVEQILFTEFEIVDDIPGELLVATIDTEGFAVRSIPESTTLPQSEAAWRTTGLPSGFSLSLVKQSSGGGFGSPVDHLIYSDGLATVSVFVVASRPGMEWQDGFSTFGSTNAFSLTLDGRKVTAVGEVPRRTVRDIASSLSSR